MNEEECHENERIENDRKKKIMKGRKRKKSLWNGETEKWWKLKYDKESIDEISTVNIAREGAGRN